MTESFAEELARCGKDLGRGTTRLALLALLDKGDSYGYEILQKLRAAGGSLATTEATVYPLLKDMEVKLFLSSHWKSVEDGVPPRKYYKLTATGATLYQELSASWTQHNNAMETLLK